jgi:hypothetical protein
MLSVQHFYVLRRFSSWSFRLGVSVALLVSSAGLAASILVEAATSETELARAAWQPLNEISRSVSRLPAIRPTYSETLPTSARKVAPFYFFTANAASGAPLAQAASSHDTQLVTYSKALPTLEDSSLKTALQRSWRTFKLAFR